MKRFMIAAIALISIGPAHAERYTYACKAKGKSSTIRVDDAKHTLQWGGKTYVIKDAEDCPRFGWRVEGNGKAFSFCTATQGMADFKDGSTQVQCDQKR